ncbi:baeRF7 domain-containing protein [Mastigocoleus testarum]|nr:hypothetical protein [Mastigocoleus testarum]
MPTHKAGKETRQNPIRFKNLLDRAESKLVAAGLSTTETGELLQEAKTMIDDYDFWQHQELGLAYFISQSQTRYYLLPHSFTELVEVSDRFYFKPLLPLMAADNEFYLLALAQNQIRLFQASHYNIQELALPEDVPSSLAEALSYDDPEKQLQYHSVGKGAAKSVASQSNPIYHGQGVGTTDNKTEILRYFQQIDRGLHSLLQGKQVPLVLAGVEYLLPIYQEANSYPHLYSQGVTGNPENLSSEELHQQALQVIQPHFQEARQQAIAQYQELLSTKQASADVKQIIPAAINGQVDTLFIPNNLQCWGRFEPETNSIEIDDSSTKENFDLLDFAATNTFLQGGMVYCMSAEEMPDSESVAAIFRYPVYANSSSV